MSYAPLHRCKEQKPIRAYPNSTMRILIYKRTHRGDPDARGIFGINDCMGSVRDFHYDAVIGIGGIGEEPQAHGIAGTINWIGIGPRKVRIDHRRGALVTFDHFLFHDTAGPDFRTEAPHLAAHIYNNNVRILLDDLTATERAEASTIVNKAYSAPASIGRYRIGYGLRKLCPHRPPRLALRGRDARHCHASCFRPASGTCH